MTSTLADAFGSGIMVPGYGFLLNDSLTLFNLNPRANPATGNPGANDAAGGKRPMGSMAPTLVLKDGEPFLGSGTYSGAFIPSVVLNVVLNVLEYGMPIQPAVDAPRIWDGGRERRCRPSTLALQSLIVPLRAMGHRGPGNWWLCRERRRESNGRHRDRLDGIVRGEPVRLRPRRRGGQRQVPRRDDRVGRPELGGAL